MPLQHRVTRSGGGVAPLFIRATEAGVEMVDGTATKTTANGDERRSATVVIDGKTDIIGETDDVIPVASGSFTELGRYRLP